MLKEFGFKFLGFCFSPGLEPLPLQVDALMRLLEVRN